MILIHLAEKEFFFFFFLFSFFFGLSWNCSWLIFFWLELPGEMRPEESQEGEEARKFSPESVRGFFYLFFFFFFLKKRFS
jgi:hypothetical protein